MQAAGGGQAALEEASDILCHNDQTRGGQQAEAGQEDEEVARIGDVDEDAEQECRQDPAGEEGAPAGAGLAQSRVG
jgi:hypothetical protein